jgi:UDP-N-acetylmuramoylalanine--D-glutamate ligase
MIKSSHWKNKTFAVVGLGKSGLATCAALKASGAELVIWDDKQEARLAACERFDIEPMALENFPWASIDRMILSPGMPLTHPQPHRSVEMAKQYHVPIMGDVELLQEAQPDATYLCITGTNGKSTTTALVAHLLKSAGHTMQMGGNIGTPVLACEPLGEDGVYVLELSSYQLDLLQIFRSNISLLLNISEDHLDRHGDMAGYIAAKKHIFDRQGEGDVAIVGVDDAYSEAVARELVSEERQAVVPISVTQDVGCGVDVRNGVISNNLRDEPHLLDINEIPTLKGAHNHQNAAAAYAACVAAGLGHDEIAAAMPSFGGLAHRMEFLGVKGGVTFVNDSKATNADAAEKALLSFEDIYWILGGVPKAGGIESLQKYFPKVKKAYLIGQAEDVFTAALGEQVEHEKYGMLEVAFDAAVKQARMAGGGVVLFSPACASFDQYPNFEVRGDAFRALYEKVGE